MPPPPKKLVSPGCFRCSSGFLIIGAIFVGVGSGLCSLSVNREPCCNSSLCDGTSGSGTNSYGPCGGGLSDDDASFNSGLCGFYCGSSTSASCANQVYSCDSDEFTVTCVDSPTCCTSSAGDSLLATGIAFMVVFGISMLMISWLLLCAGWKIGLAADPPVAVAATVAEPTNSAFVATVVTSPLQDKVAGQDNL
jgi:hypothetical protein